MASTDQIKTLIKTGLNKNSTRLKKRLLKIRRLVPPSKFPTPKRSDPIKMSRLRRRLALYYVLGYTNSKIARAMGSTSGTISKWLEDDQVQKTISEMQEEYYGAAERRWNNIHVKVVKRTESLIEKGQPDVALEAIKMYLQAQGRLPVGGKMVQTDVNIQNVVGGNQDQTVTREDAANALTLLRSMRAKDVTPPKQIEGVERL